MWCANTVHENHDIAPSCRASLWRWDPPCPERCQQLSTEWLLWSKEKVKGHVFLWCIFTDFSSCLSIFQKSQLSILHFLESRIYKTTVSRNIIMCYHTHLSCLAKWNPILLNELKRFQTSLHKSQCGYLLKDTLNKAGISLKLCTPLHDKSISVYISS